jgi:DNA polymerase-3 subunit epsilon
MKLNLKRPLAFFDLETTGVNVASDRIVEIAILKAMPDGDEIVKTLRINPEMPIPLSSSLIHGIYEEDIKDAPTFKSVAQEIADFIGDADLAGYNSNRFDIPVLLEEFLRAGVDFDMSDRKFVDVQNIFHQMEQRTLKAAYRFYCDKDIINAHSAEADIKATYHVLLAQLDRYQDTDFEDKQGNISKPVQNDVDALHLFTNMNKPVDFAGRMVFNENNEETFNFGKHKGKCCEHVFDLEPSYYAWMKQGDFPLYTKKKLEEVWVRWNKKKDEARALKQAQQPKAQTKPLSSSVDTVPANPAETPEKAEVPVKAAVPVNRPHFKSATESSAPELAENEKAVPQKSQNQKSAEDITNDMLQQLKMKFGK